jgi:hypothetical protein
VSLRRMPWLFSFMYGPLLDMLEIVSIILEIQMPVDSL